VATVEDVQPPPCRKAWQRSGTLRKLSALRDLRPSISLVSFAG
jgi:hypothetical protein